MSFPLMPPVPAPRTRSAAFTMTELLVVIAIIVVLAGLSIPVLSNIRGTGQTAKNLARMKNVAAALITGAGENRGFLPSSPSTRGRWPTAAHQYLGIRTDLDASNWGQAAQINQSSYTAEVMRPVHLAHMRKAMLDGSRTLSPQGIWLVNNSLIWRGQSAAGGIAPKPLVAVVAPSKTPFLGMPAEDNGLGTSAKGIHPSASAQGFTGQTDITGPAPIAKGKMFYVMCDGSAQTLPDFWPFQDPEWPEPWKAFHPLGKNAPASDAP
jgi:prepilin-type N-terminal cleavage/methylation domain-containing protein